MKQLEQFIKRCRTSQLPSSEWLTVGSLRIYVRHTWRYLNGKKVECLDLATIGVISSRRGKGVFTEFLKAAEKLNPWEVTFVENVFSERFQRFFQKREYHEWRSDSDAPPCYYKMKE